MKKKPETDKPPECWVAQQPDKPKKKLWGIWARYNKPTKSRIEKECGKKKEKKRNGEKKRKG